MDKLIYLVPVTGVIGLLYTFIKFAWVSKQDPGNDRMQEISRYIAEGAMAFLKAEWKILSYFVVLAAILLAIMGNSNPQSHWSIASRLSSEPSSAHSPDISACAAPPRPMCVLPRQPGPVSAKRSQYPSPVVPSWAWVWPVWPF
jgi:hypothetical protein